MTEEQRACAVCQVVTTHYDGACEQCLIRRDRAPVQHSAQVAAQPQERSRRHIKLKVTTVVAVVALVITLGFVHIVYGGGVGLTVCAKDGWSLSDTVVDLDDFIGKPLIQNLDRAKVLRAMFECGTLERPNFGDR